MTVERRPIPHQPVSLIAAVTRFIAGALCCIALFSGCKKSAVDQALDSDANGYMCLDCEAKFYTDRDVFASYCPKCKKPNVEQVLGYVCEKDKAVAIGPRSRGARSCPKCGVPSTAVSIPRENDLKAWGAPKATGAEVGG